MENNTEDIIPFMFHYILTCIIAGIGLPLTLVAIYALYSLVRNDQVAPIYVINLLVSDVIQLCSMIVLVAEPKDEQTLLILGYSYIFGLFSSICFMLCVALERYLVIACPLWYCRQNIKTSVVLCVVVWAFNLVFVFTFQHLSLRIIAFFFYFPLPLFIFFLGGTLKSLSASRVPSDEKRQIVGILVLVLFSYTLLFLPSIIMFACFQLDLGLSGTFLKCSPLPHLFLYVFMRKGFADELLASVCCCRMDNNNISQTTA
uniref:G-protein coupled receptors family 1 profile domain-containing protein n=1 Tax=Mola mola TaxID=94237 RepID=A0A3Q3W105_MOLML